MTPMSGRRQQQRVGSAAIETEVAAALLQLADETKARYETAKARRDAREASRPKFTSDDLRGAAFVRSRSGWHEVVRVNKTSVTVKTGYSWDDRIPLDKILQAVKGDA